ncbi:hypothetical protein [Paenibacillus tundrae]
MLVVKMGGIHRGFITLAALALILVVTACSSKVQTGSDGELQVTATTGMIVDDAFEIA